MRRKHRFCDSVGIVLALCTVMVVIPSCIDEQYNLKDGLNSDMYLGGNSLAFPIGSTDTIRLRDYLSEDDVKMLETMEDGSYSLTMKDSIYVEVPKIDQTNLKINDQTFQANQKVSFGGISLRGFSIPDITETSNIEAKIKDSIDFKITLNSLPKEIESLDSIIVDNGATMEITIDLPNMPKTSNPLMADMTIDFPTFLQFENTSNQLVINQPFDENKLIKTYKIRSLHPESKIVYGNLNIDEKIRLSGRIYVETSLVDSINLTGESIDVNVNVTIAGIKFKSIYGQLNPNLKPITTDVLLSDIPDFMKGDSVSLDLTRPVITIETQSNLGIPVDANIKLTPMRDGSVIANNERDVTLNIPKATSGVNSAFFWIGPNSDGKPDNYLPIEKDIQMLFIKVPDEIKFKINASANMGSQHFIDLNADYKMKVKYDVTVPLAFGEELNILISDTIADLDESFGKFAFSGKSLEVYGEVFNSIPLDLTLTIIPLDENNRIIKVTPASQVIAAGTRDGGATSTKLSVKFNDPNGLLKEVRGFEMKFLAKSNSTVAGTAIRPDNFVKANLKVKLLGGINVGDK